MKKSILFFITLFFGLSLQAQHDPYVDWKKLKEENLNKGLLSNEEFFQKAELIIEGKILHTFGSYDGKGNLKEDDIYTMQSFLVDHVYKGDILLEKDTLYVLRHCGTIEITHQIDENNGWWETIPPQWKIIAESEYTDVNDPGLDVDAEKSYIFFLIKSYYPDNPQQNQHSAKTKYQHIQENKAKAILKVTEKIYGLSDLVFNSHDEFFNYAGQFEPYGFSAAGYYKEAEQYYQLKKAEVDAFMQLYPNFEIPDTNMTVNQLSDFFRGLVHQTFDMIKPVFKEFTLYSKIQALQKELNDFLDLQRTKSIIMSKEIGRIAGKRDAEREEAEKKKVEVTLGSELNSSTYNITLYLLTIII